MKDIKFSEAQIHSAMLEYIELYFPSMKAHSHQVHLNWTYTFSLLPDGGDSPLLVIIPQKKMNQLLRKYAKKKNPMVDKLGQADFYRIHTGQYQPGFFGAPIFKASWSVKVLSQHDLEKKFEADWKHGVRVLKDSI